MSRRDRAIGRGMTRRSFRPAARHGPLVGTLRERPRPAVPSARSRSENVEIVTGHRRGGADRGFSLQIGAEFESGDNLEFQIERRSENCWSRSSCGTTSFSPAASTGAPAGR